MIIKSLIAGIAITACITQSNPISESTEPAPSAQTIQSIYDFKVESLDGGTIDFSAFKGKKILIVNTASQCGYTKQYDPALQALTEISYAKWRDHDPEDTMRFFSLRLREADMIKSSPQKIIASGTDWRFLNEIKRELKT